MAHPASADGGVFGQAELSVQRYQPGMGQEWVPVSTQILLQTEGHQVIIVIVDACPYVHSAA